MCRGNREEIRWVGYLEDVFIRRSLALEGVSFVLCRTSI